MVTEAFGGRGGVAAVTRHFTSALAGLEDVDEVQIVTLKSPLDMVHTPSKIRQRSSSLGRVSFVTAAVASAAARRPQLVYCDHLHLAPAAVLAARLAGARLVVQLHGVEIWTEPSPLRRYALESADLLLCVSRETRKRALSFLGLPPERALVLNNTFDVAAAQPEGVRQERWVPPGSCMLLTVSRLSALERYKGHEHVFDAVAMLRSQGVDVTYVVAGDGDDRPRLEGLARTLGIANHVRFLGQVSRADLLRLYRAASVFVMPSSGEGFGIAFVEAMAAGTPAIGLPEGGATDALADRVIGLTVPIEGLADGIIRAMSLSCEQRALGASRTRTRFGPTRYQRAIAGLWQRLFPSGRLAA